MASRAFLIPVVISLLVLVAPGAQAALVVTVTGPDRAPEVTPGESGSVEVQVSIATTGNVVCPQDGPVSISLRAGRTDDSLGLSGAMNPTSLDFTIPTGAYTDQTSQYESEAQSATMTMTVDASKLPPGHNSHTLAASATYDGSAVGLCQGDIGTDEASDSHDVNFPIKQLPQEPAPTPSPGTGGDGTGGTGGGGGGNEPPPAEEGSAPGVFLIVLAGLALAAFRRRA